MAKDQSEVEMSDSEMAKAHTGSGDELLKERRPDGTLYGMAEAERQVRVARQLYEKTRRTVPWEKLPLMRKREFIDRACQPPNIDE